MNIIDKLLDVKLVYYAAAFWTLGIIAYFFGYGVLSLALILIAAFLATLMLTFNVDGKI